MRNRQVNSHQRALTRDYVKTGRTKKIYRSLFFFSRSCFCSFFSSLSFCTAKQGQHLCNKIVVAVEKTNRDNIVFFFLLFLRDHRRSIYHGDTHI